MKRIDYLENVIQNNLLEKQKKESLTRKPADCLTGSMLCFPLQEQVLMLIGSTPQAFEAYTLRKFERGHHVEEWIMSQMPGLLKRDGILELAKTKKVIVGVDDAEQAMIEYKSPERGYRVKGHIDGMVDMTAWEESGLEHLGIIPHEVKSITNANFKWVTKRGEPDWHHMIQIGFYAMALDIPYYMIHYVASDDYRILSFLCQTKDIEYDVRSIIGEVYQQLATGRVPAFAPRVDWQKNKDYQKFPQWSDLDEQEATEKLRTEYPEAYKRLQLFAKGGER